MSLQELLIYGGPVLFIVVASSNLLKLQFIKRYIRWKFLVPVILSLFVSICFFYSEGVMVVIQNTIEYVGKSVILFELYKNIFRRS